MVPYPSAQLWVLRRYGKPWENYKEHKGPIYRELWEIYEKSREILETMGTLEGH